MSRPSVYVTRKLPSPGLEMLSQYCQLLVHQEEGPPRREELLRNVKGKDALLCLLTDKIDAELLDAAPTLRVVSSLSVGFEHVDVAEATKRGVYVGYTPAVLTEATADFAWALILAVARRVAEGDAYVRGGKWNMAWGPMTMLGEDVHGKTLGILGMGRIGKAVAQRARGFNMRCLYYDVFRSPPDTEREMGVEYTPIEKLLAESDFVTIHVPAAKETTGMINEEKLRLMKKTAFLINTARGAVVDEQALAKALRDGWIAGAGLDVFQKEPIPKDHPLLGFRNVVLTPHLASASKQARSAMAELAAKNLLAALKGERPPSWVNPEVEKIRPLSSVKMF
ncbi:MAG: D-glycerate dehydrogenase [Thaumarchaeota archaeon]|nr:D-glycerate dehydrogenase [Nitrososphaerota archaeon]